MPWVTRGHQTSRRGKGPIILAPIRCVRKVAWGRREDILPLARRPAGELHGARRRPRRRVHGRRARVSPPTRMAWGTFGASPGGPPNPGFAGASAREAGGIRRARRLAVLGTAAGLASGLGIQRRAAHAKMGPGGAGGGTGSGGQGKRPAVSLSHARARAARSRASLARRRRPARRRQDPHAGAGGARAERRRGGQV